MFLYGGTLHLLGNMLFLWVFGGSVEDRLGHIYYALLYFLRGIGAGEAHTLANWGSRVPSIGASGDISGSWCIHYSVPLLSLGYWFLVQFRSGLGSSGDANQSGVAWLAHVCGFLLETLLMAGARDRKQRE